ncbi:anthocyanin regulatory Lc protein-like [Oryza brachyantha]|nr:anthocyanin regulatory Lc protein-like [Oryza brachyantha]
MMGSAPNSVVEGEEEEEALEPGTMRFRKQLAAAVRSISWSYAIFWSISTSRPGVLTWNDGFYNGETKTRKITRSTMELTAEQLVLQRSEQLRELYNALLSGDGGRGRGRRPITALSPEDLGDVEWYYVICMTYAFRPGQCLPGKSFASNGCAWLCNAQCADSKTFPRKLLAKSASIQTIVCIPFMNGVLELGTTDPVSEEPNVVNRIATSFWELQLPATSSDASAVLFDDLVHSAVLEDMLPGPATAAEIGDGAAADLEQTAMEIDEMIYSLIGDCQEDGLDDADIFVVPSLVEDDNNGGGGGGWLLRRVAASPASCFVAWKRTGSDEEEAAVVAGESPGQKLLKKAVGGGAWMKNNGRGPGNSMKNHVVSERRRREKLNEMFLILKSLIPSINKVDKASILAETIAYLKELERRVQELESSRQGVPRDEPDIAGNKKQASAGAKAKRKKPPSSEVAGAGGGAAREHHHHSWVVHSEEEEEGAATASDVHVMIVTEKEQLQVEVRCRWKELVMTRVFDAIKSLRLDVLSVQASAPDGLLRLNIRAKYASSAAVPPGVISEALRTAVGN